MVQPSATNCSSTAILWVSLGSFAAIILCVASERVFIVTSVYFIIDSVRKLLDIPSCMSVIYSHIKFYEPVFISSLVFPVKPKANIKFKCLPYCCLPLYKKMVLRKYEHFSKICNELTDSMEQSPSWEANSHSASQVPAFNGTRRFIAVFTTARHWSLRPSIPRPRVTFRIKLCFYGEDLLAPRSPSKMEDHPFRLSATFYHHTKFQGVIFNASGVASISVFTRSPCWYC
jgi:hypothetical protein